MERKKAFGFVVLLSALLLVPVVFGFAMFKVSNYNLFSSSSQVSSGSPNVFVDPATVMKDYSAQPMGSTFTVYINISSVTDLYCLQINLTWNHAVLNVTRIGAGEFLLRITSPSKTASYQLGFVINQTDNVKGYSGISDSDLGAVSGISGSGRLVSVQFKVVGYGTSNMTISLLGNLKTTLLDSTGAVITFTTVDGYFKNKLNGDANGDRVVNSLDMGGVNGHWSPTGGPFPGSLGYSRDIDCNNDGVINSLDIGVINGNWGRSA